MLENKVGDTASKSLINPSSAGQISRQFFAQLSELPGPIAARLKERVEELDRLVDELDDVLQRSFQELFQRQNEIDSVEEYLKHHFESVKGKAYVVQTAVYNDQASLSDIDGTLAARIGVGYNNLWYSKYNIAKLIIPKLEERGRDFEIPTATERLAQLLSYSEKHGNEGLEELAKTLFPEWSFERSIDPFPSSSNIALPSEAPETYSGLRGPENPPEFVERVYGPWLGHGLTRAHIYQLDHVLYRAIDNWSRKPGNEWPSHVDLPTAHEWNIRRLDELKANPDVPTVMTLGEARRLVDADRKRTQRHNG